MNFFGMLGQIGRILPGYVEGRRQAIQDNWQDLQNYNTVLNGQLQNAFSYGTMEPQISNVWNQAAANLYNAQQSKGEMGIYEQTLPYRTQNAVPLYQQQVQQMQQMSQLYKKLSELFAVGGFGGQPITPAIPAAPTSVDPKSKLPAAP